MSPVLRALALSIPAMLAATVFGQTKDGGQPAERIEICTNCSMVGFVLLFPPEVMDLPLQRRAIDPALLIPPILPPGQYRPDEPL
jgi:hypothetical protein